MTESGVNEQQSVAEESLKAYPISLRQAARAVYGDRIPEHVPVTGARPALPLRETTGQDSVYQDSLLA